MITTMGVMKFDANTKEMMLVSVHPGITADAIRDNTGFPLKVDADLSQTPPPTEKEIAMLQRFDPQAYWTGD